MSDKIKLQMQAWRGYSAYEVAVQNGFSGDVKQWLESLKGGELQITVCGKNVDENGNIVLLASDIKMVDGGLYSVKDEIESLKEEKINTADIVNTLKSTDAKKPLSAAQGNELYRTKFGGGMQRVTIPTDGWTGTGPYIQDIAVERVTESENGCGIHYGPVPESRQQFLDSELWITGQKNGAVTVSVEEIPKNAFDINILVLLTSDGVSE